MKKLIMLFGLFFVLSSSFFLTSCSEDLLVDDSEKVVIHYFYAERCPMCEVQEPFLDSLKEKYDFLEIKKYDLSEEENEELLEKLLFAYEERIMGVPITFISEEVFAGFGSADSDGRLMEDLIINCNYVGCKNPADVLRESYK